MNNITMYPYCKVAYKEDDSLGWKLAVINGEKDLDIIEGLLTKDKQGVSRLGEIFYRLYRV